VRDETHGRPGAGRCGEQQIPQIGGEHPHRFLFGPIPQPHPQIYAEVDLYLGAPSPACSVHQPFVARTPPITDTEAVRQTNSTFATLIFRANGFR
jgi:hypothetical protein